MKGTRFIQINNSFSSFIGYFTLGGCGGPVRTEIWGLVLKELLKLSLHGYGGPTGCPLA